MLGGASVEEIVCVLKFIILSVVKFDGAYEFDEFKFFNPNKLKLVVFLFKLSNIVILWLNFKTKMSCFSHQSFFKWGRGWRRRGPIVVGYGMGGAGKTHIK